MSKVVVVLQWHHKVRATTSLPQPLLWAVGPYKGAPSSPERRREPHWEAPPPPSYRPSLHHRLNGGQPGGGGPLASHWRQGGGGCSPTQMKQGHEKFTRGFSSPGPSRGETTPGHAPGLN
ncbi:hypothetical protein Sjap_010645 [Stephania japonica]|uniref:Uncharacterized protein n=1 Tax=Stephania japonica TaxID=461633 RepID=A0AAP0JBZ4_9MAGN